MFDKILNYLIMQYSSIKYGLNFKNRGSNLSIFILFYFTLLHVFRRFDPSFIEIKNRVKNGEIGPLHMIKTCSRDAPLPSLEYLSISSNFLYHFSNIF